MLREEIESRAQCPKNGMVCCYNETILQDVEDFLVNVFSSNEYDDYEIADIGGRNDVILLDFD